MDCCQQEIAILPTDIVPMTNYANARSFANVEGNKKAIAERGWFPYNRNLLLHPDIRNTMSAAQLKEEKEKGFYPSKRFENEKRINEMNRPTMMEEQAPPLPPLPSSPPDLNFGSGSAMRFLKRIVRATELQEARKQIIEEKKEGGELKDRLKNMTKLTAANLTAVGVSHTLGRALLDEVQDRVMKKEAEEKIRKEKADAAYLKLCAAADKILAAAPNPSSWNATQFKTVLKPLKRKEDKFAMPSKKDELIALYDKWQSRGRRKIQVRAGGGELLVEELTLPDDEESEQLFELPVQTITAATTDGVPENTKPEKV
jgi:hypothetical protein